MNSEGLETNIYDWTWDLSQQIRKTVDEQFPLDVPFWMKTFPYVLPALGVFYRLRTMGIYGITDEAFMELVKRAGGIKKVLHPYTKKLVEDDWTLPGTCIGDRIWPQAQDSVRFLLQEDYLEAEWIGDFPGLSLRAKMVPETEQICREIQLGLPNLWADVARLTVPLDI